MVVLVPLRTSEKKKQKNPQDNKSNEPDSVLYETNILNNELNTDENKRSSDFIFDELKISSLNYDEEESADRRCKFLFQRSKSNSLGYDEESNETSVSKVNESLITTFNTNNEEETGDKAMSAYSLDYGEDESNETSVSRVNKSLITTFNANNEEEESNATSVSRVNESLITTFNTNNEEETDDKAMSACSLDYGEESNETSASRVNESLITTFNANNEESSVCIFVGL
ncbi:hypothetical protein F8M41_017663 [Gigaspora margarita]|uniref:Uncharacterized protein n=1 Tax=Gigaspora margarita TaxID=4874 RepID=A0A8H4AMW7_GIGMA|nr:hypothetical protein F8M41_017663 [Gigaspora margarita]